MKTFIFEYNKLCSNKIFYRVLLGTIVVLISFFIILFLLQEVPSYNIEPKEEQLMYYEYRIKTIENTLENETLDNRSIKALIYEKAKLEFFVANQKVESEYLDISDSSSRRHIYQGTSLMYHIFNSTYVLSIVFALFVSIYAFGIDLNNGALKNILASTESRKKIFLGKILFQLTISLGFLFSFLVVANLCGLFSINAEFLIYKNGVFSSLNCLTSFYYQSIGLVIAILLISVISNFIILFTKSISLAISIPVCFLTLLVLILFLLDKHVNINDLYDKINPAEIMVFLNIEYIFKYVHINTIYWTFGYIVLIMIIYFVISKKFISLDY
mgnify:CR=1 FL=1|jgi:hypothetical protein